MVKKDRTTLWEGYNAITAQVWHSDITFGEKSRQLRRLNQDLVQIVTHREGKEEMKMTESGKDLLDKAVKQNSARLCQNCDRFRMCKLYDRTASTIVGLFGENEAPYDPNFLAERCDEFRHKALVKQGEDLFTV